jgi:hypothetical protein
VAFTVAGSLAVAGLPFLDAIAILGVRNAVVAGLAFYAVGLFLAARG